MNCPICNKELQPTNAFCPDCGFEIHILPAGASDAVKEYEHSRIENYKNIFWHALQESIAKTQKFEAQCQKIQQKLDEKQKELEDSIKDLSEKLSSADQDKRQLEAQLKEKQNELKDKTKELGDLLSKAQHNIDGLESQLKEKEEEVNRCKKEIKSQDAKSLDIINGIVSIKNKTTGLLQYIPVFRGVNTYGASKEDNRNHHEINIPIRGNILPPKIFSVMIDRQIIIKPLCDAGLFRNGSPIPLNGIAVSSRDSILFNNTIEIHISYFKL